MNVPASRARALLPGAVLLLLASCGGEITGCGTPDRFGLLVGVIDVATLSPVGNGASVTISQGDYSETRVAGPSAPPDTKLGLAKERPGTYQIHIERVNYIPRDTLGVVVARGTDRCGTLATKSLVVGMTHY